jgi:hypothetical protein
MGVSELSVCVKSPKGINEISTRAAGLNPRLRQLLILLDGKRAVHELAKMLPTLNVPEALGALIGEGFAENLSEGSAQPITSSASSPAPAPPAAPPSMAQGILSPGSGLSERDAIMRTARLVTEKMGPNADSLALRIEKCKTITELQMMVPQILGAIEATLGKSAAADFASRLGVSK